MIKRISLLLGTALLAAMMMVATAVPVFADQLNKCESDPDFKQCEVTGPGNSENTSAKDKNPNVKVARDTGQPD